MISHNSNIMVILRKNYIQRLSRQTDVYICTYWYNKAREGSHLLPITTTIPQMVDRCHPSPVPSSENLSADIRQSVQILINLEDMHMICLMSSGSNNVIIGHPWIWSGVEYKSLNVSRRSKDVLKLVQLNTVLDVSLK